MPKNIMQSRTKVSTTLILILFGGYTLYRLVLASPITIPEHFDAARREGALISQSIVVTSNELAADLSGVNDFDRAQDHTEALNLTTEIAKKGVDIRSQAVELSQELEIMTRALSDIKSIEAREAAFESIGKRLSLISHLIDYSNGVSDLVEVLRGRFTGDHRNVHVADLIIKINEEVSIINTLNHQAAEAIKRFDEIVK